MMPLHRACNKCRSLILYDATKCPNECGFGYAWDLRISSKLYDGSGAIKMVLTKDLAAKVLQRNLSQLILNASLNQNSQQQEQTQPNNNSISTLNMEVPSSFDIMEAVLPDNVSPSLYTRSNKQIVSDGRNLVYFPVNDTDLKAKFAELNVRRLILMERRITIGGTSFPSSVREMLSHISVLYMETPVNTRKDKIKKVRGQRHLFSRYRERARKVLDLILELYADKGYAEL